MRERTAEIGLIRSLGAVKSDVHNIFLLESILLAGLGGLGGLILGGLIVESMRWLVPGLPLTYSVPYALAAETVAMALAELKRAAALPGMPLSGRSLPSGNRGRFSGEVAAAGALPQSASFEGGGDCQLCATSHATGLGQTRIKAAFFVTPKLPLFPSL